MRSRYGSETPGQEQQQLPWEVLLEEVGTTAAVKPAGNHVAISLNSTVPANVPVFENPPTNFTTPTTNEQPSASASESIASASVTAEFIASESVVSESVGSLLRRSVRTPKIPRWLSSYDLY